MNGYYSNQTLIGNTLCVYLYKEVRYVRVHFVRVSSLKKLRQNHIGKENIVYPNVQKLP